MFRSWFPPFLAGGAQIELPRGPSVDVDPAAAWQTLAEGVQAVLDAPTSANAPFTNPHTGTMPVAEAIYKFFAGDVFLHCWNLARATDQDDTLNPDRCEEMLAGLEPIDDILRSSGQYGARVHVADDVQTKLIACIERIIKIRSTEAVAQRWRGEDLYEELADDLDDGELLQFAIETTDGHVVGMVQFSEEGDSDYRHASIDIFIDPAADNHAAIACYSVVGFKPVGITRSYERSADGSWSDGLLMDMLHSDRPSQGSGGWSP